MRYVSSSLVSVDLRLTIIVLQNNNFRFLNEDRCCFFSFLKKIQIPHSLDHIVLIEILIICDLLKIKNKCFRSLKISIPSLIKPLPIANDCLRSLLYSQTLFKMCHVYSNKHLGELSLL